MLGYAIRRMLVSVSILVIATFVVFVMVSLSGDPLSELKTRNPPPPPPSFWFAILLKEAGISFNDYVRLARAKGLRQGAVITRHALRTALIPLVTVTALDSARSSPAPSSPRTSTSGAGPAVSCSTRSGTTTPMPLPGGSIAATFIIAFNLAADLLYAVLDPRIRYA